MIDINLVIITTNHIYIGAVYIMSGLIGGSIGFGLSIILRLELIRPGIASIIITGYLLFILSMIEGFLGHLLCWGQMSYWGITVMINIVAVLPCCGIIIAELIWSAAWVILNRIFVYHFLIGILIGLIILIHIILFIVFLS